MATTMQTEERELITVESGHGVLDRLVTGISQVGIGMGVMFAGLTGLWALACLFSAVAKSGGVLMLIRQWWAAVSGM